MEMETETEMEMEMRLAPSLTSKTPAPYRAFPSLLTFPAPS